MESDFWLERWRDGRTYFHQTRVAPLLQKYWPSLSLTTGGRVLVPLCGKSLDMVWLAQQGLRVLGVELSPLAVEQFFAENALHPIRHESAQGQHFVAGNIEIICGDIFKLDAATLSECIGVYDRAALIALPPEMRQRYVQHVYGQLAADYRGLLMTMDYAQEQMEGPPFAVRDDEVQALYAEHSEATIIDRRDMLDKEPKFAERGITSLDAVVYRLQGKR
ncbi:thiopurine S-methyltransferase [Herbaspirillum sp. RTI4]|uniref:thiopurine S-methyltransferase n=1 Tax=Herbaspirillum sp. RTI4 TaxID=3048640 RepID=UPI002AB37970|nr:thiopurine S-methyltransferase [Herbaspirillum sp. RTI4]MDY7576997.1 thiopurine S-methyltransferase [Herbaspirillum sp. RTI4]MEA9982100.1 thiopurine S-methyltransferase [Herbaspirillum sp. RTI4]